MFPRSIVTTDQTIADVQGILIVDERNGYFDPVSLVSSCSAQTYTPPPPNAYKLCFSWH